MHLTEGRNGIKCNTLQVSEQCNHVDRLQHCCHSHPMAPPSGIMCLFIMVHINYQTPLFLCQGVNHSSGWFKEPLGGVRGNGVMGQQIDCIMTSIPLPDRLRDKTIGLRRNLYYLWGQGKCTQDQGCAGHNLPVGLFIVSEVGCNSLQVR